MRKDKETNGEDKDSGESMVESKAGPKKTKPDCLSLHIIKYTNNIHNITLSAGKGTCLGRIPSSHSFFTSFPSQPAGKCKL